MAHHGDYFCAAGLKSSFLTAQNLNINTGDESVEETFASREYYGIGRWPFLWKNITLNNNTHLYPPKTLCFTGLRDKYMLVFYIIPRHIYSPGVKFINTDRL